MRSVSLKPYSSLLLNIEDVLSQLHGVRSCGSDKWTALCPAHPDKNPSLSIRQDGDRVLLHCFAGCSFADICAAGRFKTRYSRDAREFEGRRFRPDSNSQTASYLQNLPTRLSRYALALYLRADSILSHARGLDCSEWTSLDFDRALLAVAQAYTDLERSDFWQQLAFNLRKRKQGKER